MKLAIREIHRSELAFLKELKNKGYRKASLSVDKSNYALNLYLKFGFKVLSSTATSATMIKSF